ncbi:MAG: hypothetical protein U0746_17970 [Gemmataceae bacterium]
MPKIRLTRLEERTTPSVATWDGGGANANWTTAANWVGDVAPQPNDDLVFPLGAAQVTNVNDFAAGTAFRFIDVKDGTYNLSGNAVTLATGLSVEVNLAGPTPVIGLPLTLAADATFTSIPGVYSLTGVVNLNGHTLTLVGSGRISGSIAGTGSLTVTDGGNLLLSGTNTFTGPTTVAIGDLDVQGTLPGSVAVTSSATGSATLSGSGTVGDVTVTGGNLFAGSTFAIPSAPGTLRTGNLSAAAANLTTFLIFGPGSNSGIAVTGTARVGGTLSVGSPTGYVPRAGDRFTLLSNDGTDPVVGTFAGVPEGGTVSLGNGNALRITYRGGDGNDVVASASPAVAYAVGAGIGGLPVVNVYDSAGTLLRSFNAYATSFHGGVRVATADVTGDGVPDVITAPGPGGGPHVRVFDGTTFAVVREFFAYDARFTGGVFVAASQINFDGKADIITGAGAGGGPHVKVFDGATGGVLSSFFAYAANFTGGVSVAGTDAYSTLRQTGNGSVITGPGPGGGPHVRIFDGVTTAVTGEFFAYDARFTGGVNVAARGQLYLLNGGLIPGVPPSPVGSFFTAPASNGGPDVRVFDVTGKQIGGFLAYDAGFFGGVTLAVPTDGSGGSAVVTGTGRGGVPQVKVWAVANNAATLQQAFLAFDPGFLGGVFVG